MKNTKTKKGLVAIIVTLCFLACGVFAFNGIGTFSAYASTPSLDDGIYEFHPTIETFIYGLDEPFFVKFTIESESPATSVSYTTNGFIVTQSPFLSHGSANAQIKYNGTTVEPKFTVYANLANGSQLQASIYGIIENDTLYINGNSYAGAKDIYYAEALESGAMTQAEYEAIFSNGGGFSEITNTTSMIIPFAADNTWVSGTLQWQDDWGNIHPLQHTKITVYDQEGGWLLGWWDSDLGTTYTNESGGFSLGFSNRGDGRNVFIRVWPEGENSVVKTGANNEYVWRSGTTWGVATGSTTTINRVFNMRDEGNIVGGVDGDGNLGRAFQVSQATIAGARYASAMRGSNMQKVTVRYPHNETGTGCFYQNSNDTMYIIGNRLNDTNRISGQLFRSYASWDVIMHEYGHFVQDKLNIEDNPGGWHNGGNMYNHYMSHHGGTASGNCLNAAGNITCANPSAANAKDRAIKLAYAEAWPSILAGMAQQYYINLGQLDNNIQTVGDAEYDSYNGAWMDYNNATRGGEATEDTVIGVLWDLYDNDTTEAHDRISLGHSAWWTLTVGGQPKTFSAVTNRFYTIYTSTIDRDNFGALLQHHRMAPENINHTGTLASSTAPTFTWTANGTAATRPNNRFDIIFYNSSRVQVLSISNFTAASRTLTTTEWSTVMNAAGSTFFLAVVGYQTDNISTGGYTSGFREFTKPLFKTETNSTGLTITGVNFPLVGLITIPGDINGIAVTQIGNSAIANQTQLSQITIPASVTFIGAAVFSGGTNLGKVTFLGDSQLEIIGSFAFSNCSKLYEITIPSSVTNIYTNAFPQNTHVILKYGRTKITSDLFDKQDLLSRVTISSGATEIEENAFADCTNLTSVSIPSSVSSIGKNAFSNTGLWNNTANNSVVYADTWAVGFRGTLPFINLNEGTFGIADEAFSGCNTQQNIGIGLPKSLRVIGKQAFSNCNALAVNVAIGNTVFKSEGTCLVEISSKTLLIGGGIRETRIPSSVVNIAENAFKNRSDIEILELPKSVKTIGEGAFSGCSGLTELRIEDNSQLQSIGKNAFNGCSSLKSITLHNSLSIGANAFTNCNSLTIYAEDSTRSVTWDASWNSSKRPIFWGCTVQLNSYVEDYSYSSSLYENPNFYTVSEPHRMGYTLSHWRHKTPWGESQYAITQIVTMRVNYLFQAMWTPIQLDILYYNVANNTGSYTSNNPKFHTYGTATVLNTPTKPGYEFVGWYLDSEGQKSITAIPADSYDVDYTIYPAQRLYRVKVYAKWTEATYSITYKDVGNVAFSGSHETDYPTTHRYGTTTYLDIPTKQYYTFAGWYTNSDGTGSKVQSLYESSYTENITLYAKWTADSYSIIYKDVGDVAFSGTHTSGYPTSHTYGNVTSLDTPSKSNYTFAGWYTNSNGSGLPITSLSASGYTSSITLYAKWTVKSYSITYKDVGNVTFSGTHEADYPTSHTYGIMTYLDIPTKPGYTFAGWYTNSSGSGSPITSLSASGYTSNVTLYAKWSAKSYSITYKDVGNVTFSGTHEAGYPTSHTYGIMTYLDIPTKPGYTFAGWYTNSNGTGSSVASLSASGYTSNITLYAKWIAETYSITYKDVGNVAFSGSHKTGYPTLHTYGSETNLQTAGKNLFNFAGWYIDSNGAGSPITSLSASGYTSNITLYAKWSVNIAWIGLTANGSSETMTTTQLILTFDKDPSYGINLNGITVTGAEKDTFSGIGTTRILTISKINVDNGGTISVSIAALNMSKSVTVYLKYDYAGGYGTQSDPYLIATDLHLIRMEKEVNAGRGASSYYALTADIYLNDTTNWLNWSLSVRPLNIWTQIGTPTEPFKGSFNGNGFVVRGIYINTEVNCQGLFGVVDGGVIANVGIEQSYIKGVNTVGSVAGYLKNGSLMVNCYNKVNISGMYQVGGIAGCVDDSTISNSYNFGAVKGGSDVGGIAGVLRFGSLINNYNAGNVSGNYFFLGGIAGYGYGNILNNYFLKTANINQMRLATGRYINVEPTDYTAYTSYNFDENGMIWGTIKTLTESLNAYISYMPSLPSGLSYKLWSGTPFPLHI